MRRWSEQPDGVTAAIEEVAAGRRETLRGALSRGLRRRAWRRAPQLGIAYQGETPTMQPYLGGPMVSSYLRAPDLARVARDRCWQYWVVNPNIRSNIVAVDGESEFLFNTRLERPDQVPDESMIAAAFRASVGRDIAVRFIAHGTWTAGQAFVAERFGAGRAWMAGDAVHLFTPAGAFGMNTGMDDASNLGWKLAAMAQGWGGPGLLASYEAERRPIAFRNTGAAKALARNVGATPVRPEIGEDSPAGAAARREAEIYLSGFGAEFSSLGVQLGARYDASPIIVSTKPRRRPTTWSTTVRAACPAAVPRMCGWAKAAAPAIRSSIASAGLHAAAPRTAAAVRRSPHGGLRRTRRAGDRARCAQAGGARSLRARSRDRAARPACRLARQRRSAGRRRFVAQVTETRIRNKASQ